MPNARIMPAALALIVLTGSARGQNSPAMITRVEPVAVQRGQSAEVAISGTQDLAGTTQVLFEGRGISAEVRDAESAPNGRRNRRGGGTVHARLKVDPDAAPGPRELRIVNPRGASTVGLVVVVDVPVIPEADDKGNDEPAHAQEINLPAAVAGAIARVEDVDWYAFHADAGQRLTFSLWGNRLENKIHDLQTHLDPILSLNDARGRALAVDDNHDFADPWLSYQFETSGTYYLQVRDTTYAGNPNWTYVLRASAGPYATSTFPLAVRRGATAELHADGPNIDPSEVIRLDVPADAHPGPIALPLPTARGLTPPAPLVATDLPIVLEAGDSPDSPESAQSLTLPAAVSGRLAAPNDLDGYRFDARKGRRYTFEVHARRVGSAADPVLRLIDGKGSMLVEVDDTFGKDPRLEWTAPSDGPIVVAITDLHGRGGPGLGYVLQAEPARPDFVLTCDPDKLDVGPGARVPLFIKVQRRNGFQGPVTLEWDPLPAGVTASPLTIPPAMDQGLIVVSAAPDAPRDAGLIALRGRAETPEGPIVRPVEPKQEIYIPGGGRGLLPVETLALAVTEPSDITVEAEPTVLNLRPGQSATIRVTVRRRAGFDKPVNLAVELAHLGQVFARPLPAGVVLKTDASKTLLGPGQTTGTIVLEARPDAPACAAVPVAVLGHVSINFVVKTAYCSAPIGVAVVAPEAPKE